MSGSTSGWSPGRQGEGTDAILGARAWRLVRHDDGTPWLAPTTPRPPWPPREAPAATCSGSHTRLYMVFDPTATPHRCPDRGCTCGWHAVADPTTLVRPGGPAAVIGQVSLWGRVIEHAHGWRAEFAYPARLRLVCSRCARTGRWPAEPAVVARHDRELIPACAAHRELELARADEALDPAAVQAALLDAYVVEVLPIEAMPPGDRVDAVTWLRRHIER
jgi:hypothetical protein